MRGSNDLFAYRRTVNSLSGRGPNGTSAWWSAERRRALGHRRPISSRLAYRAAEHALSYSLSENR
jgi:hypothetical protein